MAGYAPEVIGVVRLIVAAVLLRHLGSAKGPWLPSDRWPWRGGIAFGGDFILYNSGLRPTSAALSGVRASAGAQAPQQGIEAAGIEQLAETGDVVQCALAG